MTPTSCRFVRKGLSALAGACAMSLAGPAAAQFYEPYNGNSGYQELVLGEQSHYVAFFGTRDTSGPWVDAAWAARAAQLCLGRGASRFVALRYPDEPVLPGDRPLALQDADPFAAQPVRVGAVYVPIYIPSVTPHPIDAPARQGAVRCLPAGATPRDARPVFDAAQALAQARSAGVPVK